MNKELFTLAILFGSLMYPLYGTDITFINSDNETKTIDTDQDGIMCIPGLDLDDEFVYEFISNEQTSKEIPWKKINGCFINKRDWLHAIGQASDIRTRWLNRALDFSGKEIASINVYQLIEEGAYLLTQTIDTQINSNRIACAPEQHRLPEEALNPAQVAEALGEHVVIPHHAEEIAQIVHHDAPVHIAEQVAQVPPHVNPVLEHIAEAPVPVEAGAANPLVIVENIDGHRQVEWTPVGIEVLATLVQPREVRRAIWVEVIYQLYKRRLNLLLRNRGIVAAELAAILRAIPQAIKDEIYELDLNNNTLGTLPTEIAQLPRLRILNVENNGLTELPVEIAQRVQQRELRISIANNPIDVH